MLRAGLHRADVGYAAASLTLGLLTGKPEPRIVLARGRPRFRAAGSDGAARTS